MALPKAEKKDLIQYQSFAEKGAPLYAIPMTDSRGHFLLNKDGTKRRRPANGVTWTFSSRFAKDSQNKETAWVFYLDAVAILSRYLSKPATFDLMWTTLFHKEAPFIEWGHDKLVRLFNIRSKDAKQVQAAIDAAFADLLREGIIDKPVAIKPPGYYGPTPKTGRPRRKDRVYQWQRAARWTPGRGLIVVETDDLEASFPEEDGKAEGRKT